jgi:hypothetical protein
VGRAAHGAHSETDLVAVPKALEHIRYIVAADCGYMKRQEP